MAEVSTQKIWRTALAQFCCLSEHLSSPQIVGGENGIANRDSRATGSLAATLHPSRTRARCPYFHCRVDISPPAEIFPAECKKAPKSRELMTLEDPESSRFTRAPSEGYKQQTIPREEEILLSANLTGVSMNAAFKTII